MMTRESWKFETLLIVNLLTTALYLNAN
jgi:hypothetical protein